jgi:hypothetical protein
MWGIWKTRNLACFEQKWPKEPFEVIIRICYSIDFWSKLQVKEDVKLKLQTGTRTLEQVATRK